MFDGLGTGLGIVAVTQLAGVGAKPTAQVPLSFVKVLVGVSVADCQRLQGRAGAFLGSATRTGHGAFELPSSYRGKRRYGVSGDLFVQRR